MAYSEMDDTSLVALIVRGNHDAFAALVTRHTDRFLKLAVRTLGNRADAEDTVQSVFLKFWQRPDRWQAGKSQFTTWFYRVVLNACHDQLRYKGADVIEFSHAIESSWAPDAVELLQSSQMQRRKQQQVYKAMQRLKPLQRDALNLVFYCEIPQKEAASILGISIKALESQLHRAKKRLAELLLYSAKSDERHYG